jgi:hypothetical protein
LQNLNVFVPRRLVELLEVVYDLAHDGRELATQDQEGSCCGLREGQGRGGGSARVQC